MEEKDTKRIRIIIGEDREITREKLFKDKENFHKEQALLPFEEKIKILFKLQEIARLVRNIKHRDTSCIS